MRQRHAVSLLLALFCAGCGGGSGNSSAAPSGPGQGQLVTPTFRITVPAAKSAAASRSPKYVGAGALSVTITLDTVNGGAPPSGLITTATTNISAGSCLAGCTVNGPAVPPGSDAFSVTTFDGAYATGNQIAKTPAPQTFTVTAGLANGPFVITLDGIPASFTFAAITGGTAGTPSLQLLSIAVLDADGNTITGAYANPVTLSHDIASGDLTNGTSLKVNGGAAATSVTLHNSTDAVVLGYGGLAIASPSLTLSAPGATSSSQTFTVALQPIVVTPTSTNLYATSGTGSSGSFAVSEVGWSNFPYSKTFTLGTPTCSTGTAGATFALTTTNNVTWTDTAPASPVAGNCTVPIADFTGSGHSGSVTLTFTTGSFQVN